MNFSKTQAIDSWVVPKSKQELQSFLGLASYYRRFIQGFARMSKPVTDLTKGVPFVRTNESKNALENLRKSVASATVLNQFDPKKPVMISTDACRFAAGALTEQELGDSVQPVFCVSCIEFGRTKQCCTRSEIDRYS